MNNLVTNRINMTVSSHPEPLIKVLLDSNFEVPPYQREYSWELEQVSDLYYDLLNTDNKEGHFLGSLLLFLKDPNNPKVKGIIDGQQRLTTLFLILFCIKLNIDQAKHPKAFQGVTDLIYERNEDYLIDDNNDEPRLTTGKRDKNIFRAILLGKETKPKDIKSHQLLFDALEFLKERIEKLRKDKGDDGVVILANKVKGSLFIIMLAEEKRDQVLLFKTLNARGIELSQSDLVKNEVCNNLKKIEVDEAIDLWDEMRDILEKSKANIDLFLFHFINSLDDSLLIRKKIEKERLNIDAKDNYPFVPEKYVFQVYEEKLKQIDNTEDFLYEVMDGATNYTKIAAPAIDDIYLSGLKTMNLTKCYPLLLKAKKIFGKDEKSFNSLAKAIDCISFRHSIMGNDPKDLEKFYYELINDLRKDNIIEIIDKVRAHPSMSIAQEEKFKNQFIASAPRESVSKMILERLSKKYQEGVFLKIQKDIWLEHIMPKNPAKASTWGKLKKQDEQGYKILVNRIGNLTLLQGKLNQKASNKEFKIKRNEYYKDSRLKMTQEIKDFPNWNADTIKERQTFLYEQIMDIWTL